MLSSPDFLLPSPPCFPFWCIPFLLSFIYLINCFAVVLKKHLLFSSVWSTITVWSRLAPNSCNPPPASACWVPIGVCHHAAAFLCPVSVLSPFFLYPLLSHSWFLLFFPFPFPTTISYHPLPPSSLPHFFSRAPPFSSVSCILSCFIAQTLNHTVKWCVHRPRKLHLSALPLHWWWGLLPSVFGFTKTYSMANWVRAESWGNPPQVPFQAE